MNSTKSNATIIVGLEKAGFRAAFMPYSQLMRVLRQVDAVDRLPTPAMISFEPLSVLVIAFQDFAGEILLKYNGRDVAVPILPEFLNGTIRQRLKNTLPEIANGWQTENVRGVSNKLLASLSGLGKYGYNTLCYVDRFGSYCSLDAYYTDIPCESDNRDYEIKNMNTCASCGRCVKNCATGALEKPYKVNGTNCLYSLNSKTEPIPEWVSSAVHHAVMGCIRCQEVCPINKKTPAPKLPPLELNEMETVALLSLSPDDLPPDLIRRLSEYGMAQKLINMVGRNACLAIDALVLKK